ncbi:hypothetical protein KUCAC02_017405, partial [Chaenocephalus aceratus]
MHVPLSALSSTVHNNNGGSRFFPVPGGRKRFSRAKGIIVTDVYTGLSSLSETWYTLGSCWIVNLK